MGISTLSATVVITTKNRKEDLRKAVKSAIDQTSKPHVLVIDDGSTDGTSDMIRSEFPQVILHRAEVSFGYIVQRNHAAELASGDIIISIDDDAAFSTPVIVEQTLADFDDPRIGAVAIPFIDVNKENVILQRTPDQSGIFVAQSYIGTAHALRRELFLRLGGYRVALFHQGEERDYCIRMLSEGFVVRMGRSDPIFHFESIRRDFRRMDLFGRRNDVLFVWQNTPWPWFPLHLLGITVAGVRWGFKTGRTLRMIHGLLMGYGAIFSRRFPRQPVSSQTFRTYRSLRLAAVPIEEIQGLRRHPVPSPGTPAGD